MKPIYNRILLKLSGEVLAGKAGHGIDFDTVNEICAVIKTVADMGVQVGIVVGGGNFWRGRSSGKMDRTRADNMGMLATAMNSLALQEAPFKFTRYANNSFALLRLKLKGVPL